MKIRNSFVSNSSSSSFVVMKNNLTEKQIDHIKNHIAYGKIKRIGDHYTYDDDDAWTIIEEKHYIKLSTTMDNFDMYNFLLEIEISPCYISRDIPITETNDLEDLDLEMCKLYLDRISRFLYKNEYKKQAEIISHIGKQL